MAVPLLHWGIAVAVAVVVLIYQSRQRQQPHSPNENPTSFTPDQNEYKCEYCGKKEKSGVNSIRLSCGHEYCKACIGSHLFGDLFEGQESIKCPITVCQKGLDQAEKKEITNFMCSNYSNK